MKATIAALMFLFTACLSVTNTGGVSHPTSATPAPGAGEAKSAPRSARSKWDWWSGGTQLRGANIWLKRIKKDEGMGTGVVGPPYTRDDFKALRAWGANYVNISYPGIYGEATNGGRYTLDAPVFDELKSLICDAAREGLFVVVSFRTGPRRNERDVFVDSKLSRLWDDGTAQTGWVNMWRDAALALKAYPNVVGYDLMVEPEVKTGRAAEWDRFARRMIEAIRTGAGDTETPILVGGTDMSGVEGLEALGLGVIDPGRNSKLVYTVHQYEPDVYAQQTEGEWAFDCATGVNQKNKKGKSQPDATDYKRYDPAPGDLHTQYEKIKQWRETHKDARGALPPVAVNEFGVIRWAGAVNDPDAHVFMKSQFEELEALGANYAVWKWDPAYCMGDDDYNFRHGPVFTNHKDVENRLASVIKEYWGKNDPTAAADPASCPAASVWKDVTASPVGVNGQLSVCGNQLCNQHGKPIQLRGMSTHGIQWHGWGKCITAGSLDALAGDWGADVVRVSMYVQEDGYETDPPGFTAQADRIVGELVARGLYVIIDWHILTPGDPLAPGDPVSNLERAKEYFDHMSKRFGGTPNVLYEIANEPNGEYEDSTGSSKRVDWARIKQYAEQVNAVIRANDPDGVIIVGTPDYSSFGVAEGFGPSEVYNSQLAGANIMYSFHFYAAERTHKEKYAQALEEASDRLPVFVTEWGTQKASGDGRNDFASAQRFVDLMARKKISWTSWNYSDNERSGAAFKPGTCPNGPWSGGVLKEAGAWVRGKILQPADDFPVR
ncbi:MAG TPA: cellulase family glycosylhydrolase [Pyrinomonadaceae bacterium]